MTIRQFLSMKKPQGNNFLYAKVTREVEQLRRQHKIALKALRAYMNWTVEAGECFATHLEIDIPSIDWTAGGGV